jgi:hypothetical protein
MDSHVHCPECPLSNREGGGRLAGSATRPTTATIGALFVCVAVGGVLRVAAAQGNLWLDEIYSILWVHDLDSVGQIFTASRQDNNHHLNSVWLYWLGNRDPWILYRALSLVSGIAAIAVAPFAAGRRDFWSVSAIGAIFAVSFPLVTYSSEARGYAPMLFFALASLALLRRAIPDAPPGASLAFGATAVLGFLSHLSFAHFYLAACFWSFWNVGRRRLGPRRAASILLRVHLLPIVFLAIFYLASLRDMYVAGGHVKTLLAVVTEVAALSIGVPHFGPVAGPALVAVGILSLVGLVATWRSGSDLWIFYLCAMTIAPGALLLLHPPDYLFARYFLVSLAAFLLLFGSLVGDALARGGAPKVAASISLLAICAGNGIETARFLESGRGDYLSALTTMADATRGEVVSVGSDHTFRNGSLLVFYERYLPAGKRFEYLRSDSWPSRRGPEWYLRHDMSPHPEPDANLVFRRRDAYELVASHPYYGLSGWHWFVYRYKGRLAPDSEKVLRRKR